MAEPKPGLPGLMVYIGVYILLAPTPPPGHVDFEIIQLDSHNENSEWSNNSPSEVLNVHAYVAKQITIRAGLCCFSRHLPDLRTRQALTSCQPPTAREMGLPGWHKLLHHFATFGDHGGNTGPHKQRNDCRRDCKRQKMILRSHRLCFRVEIVVSLTPLLRCFLKHTAAFPESIKRLWYFILVKSVVVVSSKWISRT